MGLQLYADSELVASSNASWENDPGYATFPVGGQGGAVTTNGVIDGLVNSIKEINLELNEWTEVELDAELVQGLVDGEQYGIAMKQAGWSNLDIASKESGNGEFAAKLVVHVDHLRAVKPSGKLTTTWAQMKAE